MYRFSLVNAIHIKLPEPCPKKNLMEHITLSNMQVIIKLYAYTKYKEYETHWEFWLWQTSPGKRIKSNIFGNHKCLADYPLNVCINNTFAFCVTTLLVFLKIVLFNSEGLCNPDVSHSLNILTPENFSLTLPFSLIL